MYIEGMLAVVQPGSFTNDKGEEVIWYVNHIRVRDEDGTTEVYKFNSKESFQEAEGRSGVFKLRAYKQRQVFDPANKALDNLYKISVVGFKQN